MGALEPVVSPLASKNVFSRKKDGGISVKSNFSVFDLKYGYYQVEVDSDLEACTAI